MMRKISLATAALLLASGLCYAGTEGRISGEVVDPEGKPIEGVQVRVSAVGLDIHRTAETTRKGKFTITVLNASRVFVIRLEKEGYQIVEEPIKPSIGGTLKPTYTLVPGQTIAPEQLAQLERKDKAAKAYNEGVQLFNAGNIDGAVALFEEALAEDPDLGLAQLALARYHLAKDNPATALPYAERAAELVPDEELTQVVLFDALWDLEQFDRALGMLDAMAASGKAADKVAVRAYNAGARAVRENDMATAKARFELALELDPGLIPAHYTLGAIAVNSGDGEAAIYHAQTYADANPDQAQAWKLLYQVHSLLGNEAEADAAFDRMAAAGPEMVAEAFFEDGVEHFNAGRNAEALGAFEKVLRAQPDHAQAHYFLGLANASAGDIPKAKEFLRRFLELAPDHPEAGTARAMLEGL